MSIHTHAVSQLGMLLQAFGYVAMKVLSLNYPVRSARSRDRVIGDMYICVCVTLHVHGHKNELFE